MPCFKPIQASYTYRPDGKKDIKFSNIIGDAFVRGERVSEFSNALSLPCSKCIGCKLEYSRQWAVRCVHEASLYEQNSFITLTFSPEKLAKVAPTGSLDRRHMQLFMKRLRKAFDDRKIRSFYCGEYGDKLGRPHYHGAMFNLDFDDKEYWKTVNGSRYYTSESLNKIWGNGFAVIGDLTFESAAYVARYCTKKITGSKAEDYYTRVMADTGEVVKLYPEFAQASLKPGIGSGWFDKYGMTDIFPRDECVSRGVICKPPRFYDTLLERVDPDLFNAVKSRRDVRRFSSEDDASFRRLADRQKCQEARMKMLVRSMEAFA